MAAIITDDFRKNNIENFIGDVAKAPTATWVSAGSYTVGQLIKHGTPLLLYKATKTHTGQTTVPNLDGTNWVAATEDTGGKDYFIGIGKTDPWLANANGTVEADAAFVVPNPTGSIIEKADVKKNLITLIKIASTDCLRLAPQIQFETGRVYKVFNPSDPSCFDADASQNIYPCYAITSDKDGHRKLFMCLANNNGATAINSIQANLTPRDANFPYGLKQNTNDNYIWAYVDYFDKSTTNLFRDSLTFLNVSPDSDIDGRMNNITGHGAGATETGTYDNGRKRAANATAGLLYGFHINPNQKGANYTVSATLTAKIVGERLDGTKIVGTEAAASGIQVTTNAQGQISTIEWDLAKAKALGYGIATIPKSSPLENGNYTDGTLTNGGGIKEATLIITDSADTGSTFVEADIQPLIAPQYGFGWSPLEDLPSYYCGVSADFKGTVGDDSDANTDGTPAQYVGESLVDVDIRQVSLVRDTEGNMSRGEDDLNADGTYPDADLDKDKAVNCLKYIQVSATQVPDALNNLAGGATIQMATSGAAGEEKAIAWVDKVSRFEALDPTDANADASDGSQTGGYRIYYHQNSDKRINQIPLTKGRSFQVFNNIGIDTGATGLTAANIVDGEYEQDTGEVMFVDNRAPIRRNKQQTEEVRLIIQF